VTEAELGTAKHEIAQRRTFAIISHPDAGKTTLTEKLLLYGGAIHLAGSVKQNRSGRQTTSDWMELERQRGISITTSVMQFDYAGRRLNLLDTPGHNDFSEDTYRTLAAADTAVMLIDSVKGVEPQTIKLFRVCHMAGIPIVTVINKLDRPGRDPVELLDEIEDVLEIPCNPFNWPIGSGPEFQGFTIGSTGRCCGSSAWSADLSRFRSRSATLTTPNSGRGWGWALTTVCLRTSSCWMSRAVRGTRPSSVRDALPRYFSRAP